MKKKFKSYIASWAIAFALFNLIVFVTPSQAAGFSKFGGAFWSGYIFILLAFAGQLGVAFFVFQEENRKKLFYKISLLRISVTGLILTLIFGSICMVIPNLPNWVGVILCFAILAFQAISLVKANVAADVVSEIDEKVKERTSFIKMLTVDAECLVDKAKTEECKKECKKVYEAIRYSDPMSNVALDAEEREIQKMFLDFSESVQKDDAEVVQNCAKELLGAVDRRNRKCRLMK